MVMTQMFNIPQRLACLVGLTLLLAACSGKPQWVKPGASSDTVSEDLAECRALADSITRRDAAIDQDILAARGADWERSNTLQVKKSSFAVQDQGRAQDIVADCMSAKGYSPKGRHPG